MSESKCVLALYDCRSKQEYIYRTNRIQEISGGSGLLADLFRDVFSEAGKLGFKIQSDWEATDTPPDFLRSFENSGNDAEIIYEGGGNLCVIYKDRETYVRMNRLLSRKALETSFTISIIAACTEVTGNFYEDRRRLYSENARQKNLGTYYTPCNVLPFTQVDRRTYQPIVKKTNKHQYTTESLRKKEKFDSLKDDNGELNLESMREKGEDSILAVIYIDGNNMGAKVKAATTNSGAPISDYSESIRRLRAFSRKTNEDFVKQPLAAIKTALMQAMQTAKKKQHYKYRVVIGGGDEITLICNAHAVPLILKTYFETLTAQSSNSACAGVALFHSHAPFADVYEIAEQSCEMGKNESHKTGNDDKNYIDFHYCHAGITNDLATLRKTQEGNLTAKPYEFSSTWNTFLEYGRILSEATRSQVKSLCDAIIRGDSYYIETLRMIQSRKRLMGITETDEMVKRMIFDIASVYDLWFLGDEKGGSNE